MNANNFWSEFYEAHYFVSQSSKWGIPKCALYRWGLDYLLGYFYNSLNQLPCSCVLTEGWHSISKLLLVIEIKPSLLKKYTFCTRPDLVLVNCGLKERPWSLSHFCYVLTYELEIFLQSVFWHAESKYVISFCLCSTRLRLCNVNVTLFHQNFWRAVHKILAFVVFSEDQRVQLYHSCDFSSLIAEIGIIWNLV